MHVLSLTDIFYRKEERQSRGGFVRWDEKMDVKKYLKAKGKSMVESMKDCYEEGKEETEIAKIGMFIRCGLFVLSVIFISGVAIGYGQYKLQRESVATSVQSVGGSRINEERKLPIYCVDCPDKKVALSFDAAWGERQRMEK